ncbi:lytic transglycosylase domain-containing protein [Novosphingobium soli]|uniref:Lytic transglycosylase domain-containing protein n=1 Tax=Novosphingobium soli TaxID=574956 RepID=A0ABV6CSJ0_9SPHN
MAAGDGEGNESVKRLRTIGGLVAAACAALPGLAQADVLQIGDAGAEWVAGGPATVPSAAELAPVDAASGVGFVGSTFASAPGQVEETPLEVDTGLHPQSITHALDAAGPTRWRLRVAQLAAKYDISPALLEAVVWQESRWNERAVSPVGARGLAQLMPGTAAQMGVNSGDPMANLEGGARYLRMQLDAFGGDIEKALAAYNAGPARVTKAGGIPNIRETKLYVAAIMARLTDPVRQ